MSSHSDVEGVPPPADACEAHAFDAQAVSRVREALDRTRVERAACLLGVLADPTRLLLVCALSVEPLCVCDLAEIAGISQSGVSHQLRVLREASIVSCSRQGRRAVYRIADPGVPELLSHV